MALGERTVSADGLGELLAVPRAGAVPLTSGYLSEDLQPLGTLSAAMGRAARRPGAWGRAPIEGSEQLRAWFAQGGGGRLRGPRRRGRLGRAGGALGGVPGAGRAGLPGTVRVADLRGRARGRAGCGAVPVPVPTDAGGVRPELLEEAFASTGSRLFYCQPLYANPHGAVLAQDRREAVLGAAKGAGAFVIEDDWARDFALEGEPPPTLASGDPDGHVVHVRSLTKILAPGHEDRGPVRQGAGGREAKGRPPGERPLRRGPVAGGGARCPVLAGVGEAPPARAQGASGPTRRARVHRPRAPAGGAASRRCRGRAAPVGGAAEGSDDAVVAAEAGRAGAVVSPGRHWFPAEPTGPFLRLSYVGAGPEELARGVAILARVPGRGARK